MSNTSKEVHDQSLEEEQILARAKSIINARFVRGIRIDGAKDAKDLIVVKLANQAQEQFGCLFLDTRHNLIGFEVLFRGTIDRSNVYPRVVARRSLDLHAAAVILCHNHPSGDPQPSQADISLTNQLSETLKLFDVRVLDHVVVGGTQTYSLAEHGLL